MGIGKTLGSYVWWTHDRGNLHYDIMVTVILLFIFVTPIYVNFNDKPVEHNPHRTGVVVIPDGETGFIYQIEGSAVSAQGDDAVKAQLRRIIEPISGEVSIAKVEQVRDQAGRLLTYKVWVHRE